MVYRFGPFELDENVYELRREGADLRIRRRSFEVLRLLIDERHRVVSKDEVLDRVWERRYVSQSALANCISELRSAFGGELESSAIIRTVYGRGYRFVAKLDEPVEAAPEPRVNATTPNGVVAPPPKPAHDAFVGRERELERLEAALDEAVQGRGQIALLLGEPGIGKTATAARFAARARGRSIKGRGSCPTAVAPIGGSGPGCCARSWASGRASARSGCRRVPRRWPTPPELRGGENGQHPPEAPPDPERPNGLFEVATRVLLGALTGPLVLIIDDVHLADAISLNLLGFLASELREASVMLVCTLQPPGRALASPFVRLLSDLSRQARTQTLELSRSRATRSSSCLARTPRAVNGSPNASTSAEGTTRSSSRSSCAWRITRRRRASARRRVAAGSVGDDLTAPGPPLAGCRTLLGWRRRSGAPAISCSGRPSFRRASVSISCKRPSTRLGRERAPRQRRGFRFRHGLIQAAVYQGLAAGERAEIHRRIGAACGAATRSPTRPAATSHHYYRRTIRRSPEGREVQPDRGESCSRAPGLRPGRGAPHAGERGERALLDPGCSATRAACTVELRFSAQFARADEILGRRSSTRAHCATGRPVGGAGLGRIRHDGLRRPGLVSAARRRCAARPCAEPRRASLLISSNMARLNADSAEVNEARVREALAIAHEHSCRSTQLTAVSFLYAFVAGPEQVGDLRATIDRFLRVGLTSPLPAARMGAAIAQAAHRIEWLDPDDGGARAEFSTVVGDERTPALLGSRIARQLLHGQIDEAERDVEALWRDWLPLANDGRLPVGLACHLLALRRDQGRMGELEPFVRGMVERRPEVSLWSVFLAFLCAETGRSAEAVELLGTLARDGFAILPRNGFWLGNAVLLAEAAAEIGHAPTAGLLYPLLAPFPDRAALVGKLVCAGPVALPLGRLATLLDRHAEAEAHLDAAERGCAALHSTSFELRTRLARADLLAARGALPQAEQLRAETRARARELGLNGVAPRA